MVCTRKRARERPSKTLRTIVASVILAVTLKTCSGFGWNGFQLRSVSPQSQQQRKQRQDVVAAKAAADHVKRGPRDPFPFYTPVRSAPGHTTLGQYRGYNSRGGLAHDEVLFRDVDGPAGEVSTSSIPQAERYSSRDWIHNMKTITSSIILKRIKGPAIWLSLWATLVSIAHRVWGFSSLTMKPVTLLGSALGLLLVMRTNSAVSRFWEGRKLWESVLCSSRDLARMMAIYQDVIGKRRIRRIADLTCAFAVALQQHVQGFGSEPPFRGLLPPEEIEQLFSTSNNKPLQIVQKMAMECRQIPYGDDWSSRERLDMVGTCKKLSAALGASETIVQTPIPLHYVRHTSRFLTIWCLLLPLVTVGELGILTPLITAMSVWALFGIQEIGLMIENPFEFSLKLEIICNTVYSDVMHTIGETELSKGAGPVPVMVHLNGRTELLTFGGGLVRDDTVVTLEEAAEEKKREKEKKKEKKRAKKEREEKEMEMAQKEKEKEEDMAQKEELHRLAEQGAVVNVHHPQQHQGEEVREYGILQSQHAAKLTEDLQQPLLDPQPHLVGAEGADRGATGHTGGKGG